MSDVPDFFRRLWRLPETPHRRGRRSTLDVETVVSTAVRLADAGGLEAATLPKVADELGVTAMSLYRHVGSKHELLMLMMDAATEPPDHSSADAGWRDGLRQWAVDLWSLYLERPWIPHVPVHSPPSGPHQVAWLEQGLDRLEPGPIMVEDKKIAWPAQLSVGGDGLNTEPLRKYRPMSPAVYFTSLMSGRSAGLFSTSLTTCLKCATASVPRCAMYQPTRYGPMSMLRI